jgi:DNA-binding beta-propeller fold protein YncE
MTTQSSTSETRARLTSARAQGHYVGTALLVASALFGSACGSIESGGAAPPTLDTAARDLLLDPEFEPENPLSRAQPASDYTLFEADPVRPIAVLPDSGLVAVANTADDFLELARPTGRGVQACGAIKVGMRPVAVALLNESQKDAELWVVNHLSDSISIVHIDPESCSGEVVETLFTGDEPRDIVVGRTHAGSARVFVTAAHRGQHHPDAAARLGKDLTAPAQLKANPGLADVFVFDPQNTAAPAAVINLFTDTPRALAVGDGVVYAAGFRTGNRSSVVHGERAAARGLSRLRELLAKDASGQFQEQNGELVLTESARGVERMQGGMPAVTGSGRCLPDPRPQLSDLFLQQVCVATDSRQHVQRVSLQREGTVDATCQCTSGDGTLQPTSSVIVKFFDRQQDCGQDFTTFPDGTRGCWLDAEPSGVRTPAAHGTDQAPPMAWNEDVKFSLPDNDVFAIGIDDLAVRRAFSGVGTVLFGMAVQPGTGRLFVTNTEAQNLTRFEGDGTSSSSTVLGHLHESRVTLIDPRNGRVQPVHLNSHVDYSRCCARKPGENESSFAFPTAAVFSPEGSRLYFSALGSDKIGIVRASALGAGFDNARARRRGELSDIVLGPSVEAPAGPVGLELDAARRRLYVKTHISNELVVIDTDSERVAARLALHTPEPSSIRAGRAVFYNARLTSSHGDSACASCHVFGDFDGISWDLGNPDGETVRNPGPFRVAPEVAGAKGLALDPLGKSIANRPLTPDFRSNKGPMNTQTLRGMANHGAQHWRGDRTRNFQDRTGTQPNFGSLNENDSFNEFDVAIAGLNGNDQELDAATFQSFTDFALQLTLPPNPVRALDDSLDAAQARARALFFGCSSLSDAQFEQRECLGSEGQLVDIDTETQACACASNPIVRALHGAPGVQRLASLLRAVLSDPALRAALVEQARNPAGLSVAGAAALPQLAAALASSIDGLLSADLSLHAKGLFSAQGAQALSDFSGAVLAIRQLPRDPAASSELLDVLVAVLPSGAPFQTGKQLGDAIGSAFAVANLDLRTVADEASRGGAGFRNVLNDCDPSLEYQCQLRVTDTLQTCHGCHTLNPQGNAEFDVYRPGFFGSSGEYSFENESQVFKVPHLRNIYQKVGMFGIPQVRIAIGESVLGERRGGFFAPETEYQGPQVRGFGLLHDGSTDTVERFHGALVFVATDGNPGAFDAVFPDDSQRSACVGNFRSASPDALGALDAKLRSALELCSSAGPVPDLCFLDPAAPACQQALAAIGAALAEPAFASTFASQILPACFQFGSMLEGGAPDGLCAPSGLRERTDMESFMLAFDSNLKPMVGQQITLHGARPSPRLLRQLLRAAALGQCDLALRQGNQGLLLTRPDSDHPERSVLMRADGRATMLADLQRGSAPITLTCYPPYPDQAEARRSAFDPRTSPKPPRLLH